MRCTSFAKHARICQSCCSRLPFPIARRRRFDSIGHHNRIRDGALGLPFSQSRNLYTQRGRSGPRDDPHSKAEWSPNPRLGEGTRGGPYSGGERLSRPRSGEWSGEEPYNGGEQFSKPRRGEWPRERPYNGGERFSSRRGGEWPRDGPYNGGERFSNPRRGEWPREEPVRRHSSDFDRHPYGDRRSPPQFQAGKDNSRLSHGSETMPSGRLSQSGRSNWSRDFDQGRLPFRSQQTPGGAASGFQPRENSTSWERNHPSKGAKHVDSDWSRDDSRSWHEFASASLSRLDADDSRRGRSKKKGDMYNKKATRREEKFELSAEVRVSEVETQDSIDRELKRREREERKKASRTGVIELPPFISVRNLAAAMKVPIEQFLDKLSELGFQDVLGDHVLDAENASLVASEFSFEPVFDTSERDDLKAQTTPADPTMLPPRPPVVTIMGHVDHGKTTLLDYLRQSSVAANEHGGITQHIGAFVVKMSSGKHITFLDTPGHSAFLSMRERGANVTDLVVLVVAADDSVKPQTIEAIKHSKAANVPIIVAISKIDKEGVDVRKVKSDLIQHGIEVEDFGGDVQAIEVSGKTGLGMDDLEEAIGALAEVLDTRAQQDGVAEGWVIEASTRLHGRVATVLVRRGTLKPGTVIVAGRTWAKIKTLRNEAGSLVMEALPGTPVEVDGWKDQPLAGDEVLEADDEHRATSVIDFREARDDRIQAGKDMEVINESRRAEAERRERLAAEAEEAAKASEEEKPAAVDEEKAIELQENAPLETNLYFLVKADVSGSTEAVVGSLASLPLEKQSVNVKILHSAIGLINESDVDRIGTVPKGKGFIVNFNQSINPDIQRQADRAQVRILDETIIYKVMDSVTAIVEEHLPPVINRRVVGEADIAQIFDMRGAKKKIYQVAGCKIRNGTVKRGGKVMVYRGAEPGEQGKLVHRGSISEIKFHKKEVEEMRKGSECGIRFTDWSGFKAGDVIQSYEESQEKRRLNSRA